MTPQEFTQELQAILGETLLSVALYGSSAIGEAPENEADYNLLVVCSRLGLEELGSIRPLSSRWALMGNPPPLLFTWQRLRNSSDVFPIELLDMKENHAMLYGEDLLKRLPVSQANLRFQLEHELKGKLIQLRESYLLTDGSDQAVADLMTHSLTTFQVLLRALLRFFEVSVPLRNQEAVRRLSTHVPFHLSAFDEIQELKDGRMALELVDVPLLFQSYLEVVENAVDLVNRYKHRSV